MKLSLNIGSREFGISLGKKAFNPSAWLRGDEVSGGGGAQLSSAYQQSTWVYACVSAIAEQVAQIPFRFSRAEKLSGKSPRSARRATKAMGETIVENGPLVELFNRPHPHLNRFQFWELLVSWLQLRGEFFAIPMDNAFMIGVKRPSMMAILDPDQFREDVRANMLAGWRYTGSGQQSPAPTMSLIPEDVITDRLANPYDFWRGMSPLTVARLAAQSDYASAQFMKGLMLNNADTGVIVTTDQQADEQQRESILAALKDRKRKAGTADRPLFLWGGAKVEKPMLSSADMQFLEQRKFNRQEICAVFKVPQEIIGFTEDANRSVSESARLNFVENRIAPLCERLEAALDPFIKSQDAGLYGWFDIEALPIMQAARRERYTGAVSAFGIGVPIDDCSEIFDLGLPDNLPHAGKSFLPFSLQEVGTSDTTNATQATDTPPPVQDIFSRASKLLSALSSQPSALKAESGKLIAVPHVCAPNPEYDASIKGSVKIKKSKLSRFFFEQRGRVLAKLAGEFDKKGLSECCGADIAQGLCKKCHEHTTEHRALDDLFSMPDENAKLLGKLKALLITDLEFGGAQLFKEIGAIDFNLPPKAALDFLAKREPAIKGINATTWDSLKSSLSDGINGGETFEELSQRVKEVFNVADSRADAIALTETNTATNAGRHEGMVQAKVERKGWKTSHLEGTRASHFENEQMSVKGNGIPIDEAWPNGLMFPGDPSGEPGETINCRCFGYALKAKGASAPVKLLRFEEWAANKALKEARAAK